MVGTVYFSRLLRLYLICLGMLVSHALVAALPSSGPAHGLLWEISSPGASPSYLFGTMHSDDPRVVELREEISRLEGRIAALPFIDTFDLRYKAFAKHPEPTSKAVMFCLMDVSGSMGDEQKELVRLEAFWIDAWLRRNYESIPFEPCNPRLD